MTEYINLIGSLDQKSDMVVVEIPCKKLKLLFKLYKHHINRNIARRKPKSEKKSRTFVDFLKKDRFDVKVLN